MINPRIHAGAAAASAVLAGMALTGCTAQQQRISNEVSQVQGVAPR
jgi:hypothetical protein